MTREEYSLLFHKLQLNLVAFKMLFQVDKEVLTLVNAAIEAEREAYRELMQQALRYMESVGQMDMHPEEWAIAVALRERLAQPENGGPKTPPKQPASRMDAGFEGGPKWHRARGDKP